jgi:hypothetical protein
VGLERAGKTSSSAEELIAAIGLEQEDSLLAAAVISESI